MRITFHGGLLLAAISASTAQAISVVDEVHALAQTDLLTEVDAALVGLEDKKKKEKKPSGIMAGIGAVAKGVGK